MRLTDGYTVFEARVNILIPLGFIILTLTLNSVIEAAGSFATSPYGYLAYHLIYTDIKVRDSNEASNIQDPIRI